MLGVYSVAVLQIIESRTPLGHQMFLARLPWLYVTSLAQFSFDSWM